MKRNSEPRTKIRLLETIASAFPYLVLATYIAGIAFCLLVDRMSYLINGSILGIPAIIASFAFIHIKRKDIDLSGKVEEFSFSPSLAAMVFLAAYIFTISLLLTTSIESRWGLVAILVLYTIILLQILSRKLLPHVTLGEIVLTLIIAIYSYTLRAALYFGSTDTMPHIYMATITNVSGHIIPGDFDTYAYFPLYHVFMALSSNVLGLDIQMTLFIITSLIFSSTVIFLYFIADKIFRNTQISLLISLIYAMNASVLYYGTYMVTRSMAYVGFLLLLYLLYSLTNPSTEQASTRPAAYRALIVVTFVFVLFTHQITTPMIIILFAALLLLEWFVRDKRHVNPVFMMVLLSFFASYWIFYANSFLWQLIPNVQPAVYETIYLANVEYLGLNFLINRIDTLFIVFFALIGIFYLLWKQQPRYATIFGILGLISILLNVPNFITTIFQLVDVLRIDRFALLFVPFLAIVMGVGIYILARHLSTGRRAKWLISMLVVLIFLYGIGSLGIVKEEPGTNRYYFNQDEMVGFAHVLDTVPSGSNIFSDYHTSRYFYMPQVNNTTDNLGLPHYSSIMMQDDLKVFGESGYIIVPNNQFYRRGLLFGKQNEFEPGNSQPYLPVEPNIQNLTHKLENDDKIYTNMGADLYRFQQRTIPPIPSSITIYGSGISTHNE